MRMLTKLSRSSTAPNSMAVQSLSMKPGRERTEAAIAAVALTAEAPAEDAADGAVTRPMSDLV